jgi:PadR family transcriptional regulator PadR
MHEGRNGFGRHGRRGGRRGGQRSLLNVRMVEPALLLFLAENNSHGYTLLEQLDEIGIRDLHPSMVYRQLRQMEDSGWIVSDWDKEDTQGPPRRVYALTEEGKAVLKYWSERLKTTQTIIANLLERMNHQI